MLYGTKEFKNGKKWGRLEFNTGKVIILKPKEVQEFESKIATYQLQERAILDQNSNNAIQPDGYEPVATLS